MTKEKTESERKGNDNVIFVGSKPLVNYIRGVITQFNKYGANEVVIKSRGKFISKAVDIAEVSKRTLEKKIMIKNINVSSESFESNGKRTNISTMDIVLGT
jgi:archaea-specific DNA-binding protein